MDLRLNWVGMAITVIAIYVSTIPMEQQMEAEFTSWSRL
jgi:hypothetical protein